MVKRIIQRVLNKLRRPKAAPAPKSAPLHEPQKEAKPGPVAHHEHESGHGQGGHRRPRPQGRTHAPRREDHRRADAPVHSHAPAAPWDPAQFVVEPVEGKTRFIDFDLPVEILHAIHDLGFKYCTPIQAMTLPHTLAGKDVFGRAQTGTGKTAAFLISTFAQILRNPLKTPRQNGTPRALILAPTRELALQIQHDAVGLAKHTNINCVAVFGGMDYDKQRRHLTERQVDLVIATPGRLLDFRQRGDVHLNHVETLIIDEGDRMLDMGFIPDMRRIINSTPPKTNRQTMLFSATLPDEVQRLAQQWTRDPVTIDIAPEQVAVDTVKQVVYIVTMQKKFSLLYNILQRDNPQRVMVFGNRRDEVERLMQELRHYNINCALLSGAVPQMKRVRVLEDFRSGKIRVLVATDVAGRGIHIEGVSHVINYNLPLDPEDYVHRIGRTGRAGASGISISFADEDDSFHVPEIEKFIGRELPCTHPEDEWLVLPPAPPRTAGMGRPLGETHAQSNGPQRRGGPRRGGPRRGPPRR